MRPQRPQATVSDGNSHPLVQVSAVLHRQARACCRGVGHSRLGRHQSARCRLGVSMRSFGRISSRKSMFEIRGGIIHTWRSVRHIIVVQPCWCRIPDSLTHISTTCAERYRTPIRDHARIRASSSRLLLLGTFEVQAAQKSPNKWAACRPSCDSRSSHCK